MTRTIAALTIALLIGAGTEAEAQHNEWEINIPTDEWGYPDPDGVPSISHLAMTRLITAGGGESKLVGGGISFACNDPTGLIFFAGPISPNLEVDRVRSVGEGHDEYRVPAKIDGTKGHIIIRSPPGFSLLDIFLPVPGKQRQVRQITEVQKSLEILFAWGRDGRRQSLTWSMDGMRETFAYACRRELEAEE